MPRQQHAAIADIPHHESEPLTCYSGLYQGRAAVFAPRNDEELRRVFAHARETGTKLTLRAGGHAFDGQSLNAELVVLMTAFSSIAVDVAAHEMTLGAGATWGAVIERLEPLGLVPYVTISTSHATCGGTLSADCLSRFSPSYGKEGNHVKRFDFMTLAGEVVRCTRPAGADSAKWTLGERIFAGVVGGMGYLGAVLRITYELLSVEGANGRIGVKSTVKKYRSYRELAASLVPVVRKIRAGEEDTIDSVFSGLFMTQSGRYAFVIHSSYTADRARRPMPQHQPESFARLVVEILLRSALLNRLLWPLFFAFFLDEKTTYIDDLAGYTFFMDGNVRAKTLGQSLGFPMRALQQTFVVPASSDKVSWDAAEDHLATFLEEAHALMEKRGLFPTMFDVLFIPAEEVLLLAASTGLDGFAVSYAFETSSAARLAEIEECMRDVSDLCAKMHGRVSLVKNVFVRPETMRGMYEDALPRFVALKRELDPEGLVVNAFFERVFPAAARDIAAAATRELGRAAAPQLG